MSNLEHKNLTAFKQHGFEALKDSGGTQVQGVCPFCHKRKFYVNVESKLWDCKVCGERGGFQGFLKRIAEFCRDILRSSPDMLQVLYDNRRLRPGSFKGYNIGYNVLTNSFTLPTYGADGDSMQDVRIFTPDGRLMSTAGCEVGLYGAAALRRMSKGKESDFLPVYLCEGEWDNITLNYALRKTKQPAIVVSVPGGGTFKDTWVKWFLGVDLTVLYDADETGKAGMLKVYKRLHTVCKSMQFVHWPKDLKKGYDVRDLFIDQGRNSKRLLSILRRYLKPEPPELTEKDKKELHPTLVDDTDEDVHGEGLPIEKIHEAYRRFLYIPDTTIIDVLLGTVVANRLPGDPLWLFFVAPPGGTKTELLMGLTDAPLITTMSSLTPHSLVSGASVAGAGDPSLIPQLNGRVLIVKDFTAILGLPIMARDEIFSTLRDAYDGRFDKPFGNGVVRRYESTFGLIAGVTPVIEQFTEDHSALGERFLRYRNQVPTSLKDRKDFIRRAMKNVGNEDELRKAIRDVTKQALSTSFSQRPEIPDHVHESILALAEYTSLLRSCINRDKYTREVTHKPFSELGTRLAKQFTKLALGVAMIRRKTVIGKAEVDILRNVAMATVPSKIENVVRIFYNARGVAGELTTPEISKRLGLPASTTGRVLEDLYILRALEKYQPSQLKTAWRMNAEFCELITHTGVYDGCRRIIRKKRS